MDYLNDNAGAVQGIATIVLVVVTTFYAIVTWRILSATQRSQRPHVYLDVTSEGRTMLQVGVGNYGEREAEDIRFRVNRDIAGSHELFRDSGPIASGIPYLPPGRQYQWKFFLASDEVFSPPMGKHVIDLTTTYRYGTHRYEEKVLIDFAAFEDVLVSSFQSPGDRIAKHVAEISHSIKGQATRNDMGRFFQKPRCPTCQEDIRSGALKCPHCHEAIPQEAEAITDDDG